jgi:hypothetical protein
MVILGTVCCLRSRVKSGVLSGVGVMFRATRCWWALLFARVATRGERLKYVNGSALQARQFTSLEEQNGPSVPVGADDCGYPHSWNHQAAGEVAVRTSRAFSASAHP